MKRLGLTFVWLVLVIVGIIAIVTLGRSLSAGVSDIMERMQARRDYTDHSAGFGAAATTISQANAEISAQQTNAPSVTPTPSDTPEGSGDGSGSVPPTDIPPMIGTDGPVDIATEIATEVAMVVTDAPTEAPTNTVAPTTVAPTNTTAPATIPPTVTRVVAVAAAATLPPTNTKRAPAVVATTAVPTEPPTVAASATFTPSPTLVPATAAPIATEAATPDAAQSAVPAAPAATLALPVVRLPGERNEKPQPTGIPSPAPRQKANGQEIINIALLGSDSDVDPTDPSFRTDSIIIVSINRTANTVAMLSVPRDLFVYIPSLGMQRINTAFQWGQAVGWDNGTGGKGGWALLQQTILYNLGIPVHYHARVSFTGFKKIVDTVGGVNVAVDCPVTDLRFQGKYDDKNEPVYEPFTLNVGYYNMDGSLALWYARMRHASSDFDRSRRQQQVLRAIWRTARDQGLVSKAPELWNDFNSVVETDLPLQDALTLAPIAVNLKPGDVSSYYMFKGYELQHWKTPAGEDVQIPDPAGFFATITNFYTPRTANRLGGAGATIEVVNASGTENWDKVAVDRLQWDGFEAVSKGNGDPADKTTIYDLTGNAKPGALASLMKATNVKQAQVISQPDPNRTSDFKIVLGKDYNSCTAPGYAK